MEIEKIVPDVTTLLRILREGDAARQQESRERLFRLVEERLHELAENHLRREGRRNPLLQTTMLVTDVFQKLLGNVSISPQDRQQFFAFARHALPQILVDYARKFQAREGKAPHIPVDGAADVPESDPSFDGIDLIALHECLENLATFDPVQHQIVIDHFYFGRTFARIAEELAMPLKTVEKKWKSAKLRLHRCLDEPS